jgi:sulfatase maturation enzyme AslB (radical SAM superfamily)
LVVKGPDKRDRYGLPPGPLQAKGAFSVMTATPAGIQPYDPEWTENSRIIPKRVVIETIFGCNAACGFCVINHPTKRAKGVMPMDKYMALVDSLAPYRDTIELFDLFGLGEPAIDPHLADRVRYAKEKGFRNTCISTNAHLLDETKAGALMRAGLDTVIFSIDGASKETHEAARVRTGFERVVDNAVRAIRLRDAEGYKTRFVVRFVRQPANAHEWDTYLRFWQGVISPEKRDLIIRYDIHTWSGAIEDGAVVDQDWRDPVVDANACHHIFEKLVILANGAVSLCFEDILDAQFGFGNAFEADPIDVFNSPRFKKIRKLHAAGKRRNLKICDGCMVLYNEPKRVVIGQ